MACLYAQPIPELPNQKFERLVKQKGLSAYEAEILVDDLELAHYYEQASKHSSSKQVINLILRDLLGYLKEHKQTLSTCKITPEKLAGLANLVEAGTINNHAAKQVFDRMAQTGENPADIVKKEGLEQVGSSDELEKIVVEIIAANPENVQEYKSGKQKIFGFFVGQAMQKTNGKGNPKIIQELLKKHLG